MAPVGKPHFTSSPGWKREPSPKCCATVLSLRQESNLGASGFNRLLYTSELQRVDPECSGTPRGHGRTLHFTSGTREVLRHRAR